MKICIVTGYLFPSRSETFIVNHALGLSQRGHNVSVISRGPGPDVEANEVERIDLAGIRRIVIPEIGFYAKVSKLINFLYWCVRRFINRDKHYFSFSLLRKALTKSSYVNAVERAKPDVVHVHYGSVANDLFGIGLTRKAIVTWHGMDANKLPRQLGESIYKELFKYDFIHTVGSSFMENRLTTLGANPGAIRKVPMGVNLSNFPYVDRRVKTNETFRIITVGRLSEEKGHEYLIRAVASLLKKGYNISLRIVGAGPLEKKLRNVILEESSSNNICLTGSMSSRLVFQELKKSNLFVLSGVIAETGSTEGQGMVLIESQATGLPVVCSDIGGMPDTIIDRKTGLLCCQKDIKGLQCAMSSSLTIQNYVMTSG